MTIPKIVAVTVPQQSVVTVPVQVVSSSAEKPFGSGSWKPGADDVKPWTTRTLVPDVSKIERPAAGEISNVNVPTVHGARDDADSAQ